LPSRAEAQLVELGGRAVACIPSVLLTASRGEIELAQPRRDLAVGARDAAAPSTTKMTASASRSPAPLARHLEEDASARRLQPTGVDGDERALARAPSP